jgi:carboxymethylenebutenolidase
MFGAGRSEPKSPRAGPPSGAGRGSPDSDIETVLAARVQAGGTSEDRLYADTRHAFFADDRFGNREEQARDRWKRLLEWFTKHAD